MSGLTAGSGSGGNGNQRNTGISQCYFAARNLVRSIGRGIKRFDQLSHIYITAPANSNNQVNLALTSELYPF